MNQIDAIRDALGALFAVIEQYGMDAFSDETKIALAELIQMATARIQQLQQLPTQTPPLEQPPVESSNINSFNYDPKSGELFVKFQGDFPQQNGSVYKYGGVPPEIADLFMHGAAEATTDGSNKWGKWWKGKIPSLGAAMNQIIKAGGFPYQKVA